MGVVLLLINCLFLKIWDGSLKSSSIWFPCDNLSLMVWVFPVKPSTCQTSSTAHLMVSIFLAYKALQGCWNILFYLSKAVSNFHFLGNYGFVKCQNVCVCLYFFTTMSNGYSFAIHDPLLSLCCFYFLWCK